MTAAEVVCKHDQVARGLEVNGHVHSEAVHRGRDQIGAQEVVRAVFVRLDLTDTRLPFRFSAAAYERRAFGISRQ